VAIVSDKSELAGQFVLLGMDEDMPQCDILEINRRLQLKVAPSVCEMELPDFTHKPRSHNREIE
jgi:hypothetical protein